MIAKILCTLLSLADDSRKPAFQCFAKFIPSAVGITLKKFHENITQNNSILKYFKGRPLLWEKKVARRESCKKNLKGYFSFIC